MSSDKTTDEYLEKWVDWEKGNDLYAPDNIRAADERNWQSPDYQQNLELRYAAGRVWKELQEALEVAEAVDSAENDENTDFDDYFEYTQNDEEYDKESVSDEEQLKDEFGFELADVALFTLKMTTAIRGGFDSEEYDPDLEAMARALEQTDDKVQSEYEDATRDIQEPLDPETQGDLYEEVMGEDQDAEKIAEQAQVIVGKLSGIAASLPKESLSEYVTEKIRYNIEERDIGQMDADHPNPEKEFKREYEK